MRFYKYILFTIFLVTSPASVYADNKSELAEAAIADILFENELDEFTTYNIDDDGSVDITFPNNMPDNVYGKVVRELKTHKDIDSVLPGRGGPACSLF